MQDDAQLLYWDNSYEIILALLSTYPECDLDALSLNDLYRMITALPSFADDPTLAHDGMLLEIFREYYEEATSQ